MNVEDPRPPVGRSARQAGGPTLAAASLIPVDPHPAASSTARAELRCLAVVADLDGDETRRQDGETDSKTVQRSPDQLQTSAYTARLRLYREAPSFP